MASDNGYTIVEYFGENDGYKCGYCKSSNSNYSHGMWAHSMTVQDYQDLIDRGFRRSGQYVYKPTNHLICCPMYTIRCSALDFKPSKSQKKIIKKIHRFLAFGDRRSEKGDNISQSSDADECEYGRENISDVPYNVKEKAVGSSSDTEVKSLDLSVQEQNQKDCNVINLSCNENRMDTASTSDTLQTTESNAIPGVIETSSHSRKSVKPGVGADNNKPVCKKAKLLRLEKKKQKMQNKGMSEEEVKQNLKGKQISTEKSLEDFIYEPLPPNPAHRLEIRLVNSNASNTEFEATFDETYRLYQKYQMAVHGDPPTKCSQHQFTRFLVNSPLKLERNGPPSGYGSFHQQYWLDNQLIAVGVIDILPKCVSSVYFYYDPDFADLSLGTYAALRETAFTRSLHYYAPSLKYYYMGFYIDSCPKMRYKARLKPSYLLCPETYSWHPFEEAQLKLQKTKYSRLNDDKNATDPYGDVNVDMVLVLYRNICMDFRTYRSKKLKCTEDDANEVKEYASLVGMKCARKMLLYRSQS